MPVAMTTLSYATLLGVLIAACAPKGNVRIYVQHTDNVKRPRSYPMDMSALLAEPQEPHHVVARIVAYQDAEGDDAALWRASLQLAADLGAHAFLLRSRQVGVCSAPALVAHSAWETPSIAVGSTLATGPTERECTHMVGDAIIFRDAATFNCEAAQVCREDRRDALDVASPPREFPVPPWPAPKERP